MDGHVARSIVYELSRDIGTHLIRRASLVVTRFERHQSPSARYLAGTGVEPDLKVSAAEALDVAKERAAEEISKRGAAAG